jgi:hypothetical protein
MTTIENDTLTTVNNNKLEASSGDIGYYVVGDFNTPEGNIVVFLHEANWVLNNKKLIPEGMLVAHKDLNPINNQIENLYLVSENKEFGDLHHNKVFHENSFNKGLIYEHFPDIAKVLHL